MLHEIKNRFTGAVLFSLECGSLHICVEAAVSAKADLSGAYLSGADLSGADLSGAYLRGADLSGADLSDASLRGADLSGAYLRGADLSSAYLSGAYLSGADIVDGGQDRRGYRFVALRDSSDSVVYHAGCYKWTDIDVALAWYGEGYKSNGDRHECLARLALLRDEAARRWPVEAKQEAA